MRDCTTRTNFVELDRRAVLECADNHFAHPYQGGLADFPTADATEPIAVTYDDIDQVAIALSWMGKRFKNPSMPGIMLASYLLELYGWDYSYCISRQFSPGVVQFLKHHYSLVPTTFYKGRRVITSIPEANTQNALGACTLSIHGTPLVQVFFQEDYLWIPLTLMGVYRPVGIRIDPVPDGEVSKHDWLYLHWHRLVHVLLAEFRIDCRFNTFDCPIAGLPPAEGINVVTNTRELHAYIDTLLKPYIGDSFFWGNE